MEIPNEAGLAIIRHFESWRSRVYRDSAGVPTIGYGSTYGFDGRRVSMDHQEITEVEGNFLLRRGLGTARRAVARLIHVPLTLNERSALISFTYNVGSGNLQSSTLRALLNRGDHFGAAEEFWKWRRAAGIILRGLVRRREAERALFVA